VRGVAIRVRGLVQGVGFRPTVWRLATRYRLTGWVANDGDGVHILAAGRDGDLSGFVHALTHEAPPLARIDAVERAPAPALPDRAGFRIVESRTTTVRTGVVPDAATCAECVAEVMAPQGRRRGYPFTNCTHCGPRLSIVESIPYDRAHTTMRGYALCPACASEYRDPSDRRFHAQPIACPSCGPRAWLEGPAPAVPAPDDAVDAACAVLLQGAIVAVKGLGGYQLACDAANETAVARLRARKRRERKPFALMARDLDVVRRHAFVSAAEAALLASPAAPIVVLDAVAAHPLAASVAPGLRTLGVMLPNTPLHHLLLRRLPRPIVLTSGNLSDEPQCIDDAQARERLAGIADHFLVHDRPIARRIDDSLARVMAGAPRLLRRARGYAPAPLRLPDGFQAAPPLLAMGGELNNAFCLVHDGQAVVSHHIGDLENARTLADARRAIDDYLGLFEQSPRRVAVDAHPDLVARTLGLALAEARGIPVSPVQHHHAHVAACLAENGIALDHPPVLGVALDGLGYGDDGTLWGGEFLLADYRASRRLASLRPVAMPGGTQAIREPWRNAYAHIADAIGWARCIADFGQLPLCRFLLARPHATLARMIERGLNSPPVSSCGRLFDAVAAAVGVCPQRAAYEGQAAIELEALVDAAALLEDDALAYPFAIETGGDVPRVAPRPMWQALLRDVAARVPPSRIAARFHKGLAIAVVRMLERLAPQAASRTVALSGGVFQNRVLLEQLASRLETLGWRVLMHRDVPAHDGGLALGQAAVAAARAMQG
jgi:hydrogenase maturation protein HypF